VLILASLQHIHGNSRINMLTEEITAQENRRTTTLPPGHMTVTGAATWIRKTCNTSDSAAARDFMLVENYLGATNLLIHSLTKGELNFNLSDVTPALLAASIKSTRGCLKRIADGEGAGLATAAFAKSSAGAVRCFIQAAVESGERHGKVLETFSDVKGRVEQFRRMFVVMQFPKVRLVFKF